MTAFAFGPAALNSWRRHETSSSAAKVTLAWPPPGHSTPTQAKKARSTAARSSAWG
ncbi:MAG TPA: hypothetical protein VFS43_38005 [Polyangiaceae bacterium]|nr:hypothetical protein [Polyangiaceae bacterium]